MEDINDRGRLPLHASNSRRYNVSLLYAMPDCRRSYQALHPCQGVATGEALSDEECETPCTYTECILSVFLSGIPSVYVTGGYTEQRWTSSSAQLLNYQ